MAKKAENTEKNVKVAEKTEKTAKKTAKKYGFVVGGALNVRKEPVKGAEIVKVVENGAKLEILGKENGFFKVPEGYVMNEYVEIR